MAEDEFTIPRIEDLSSDSISFEYDRRSDSLYIHLAPPGTPGVSVATDEHILVRITPESNAVVGIEIESFLNSAVIEHPDLLIFAELAQIPPDVMERWRASKQSHDAGLRAVHQLLRSARIDRIA